MSGLSSKGEPPRLLGLPVKGSGRRVDASRDRVRSMDGDQILGRRAAAAAIDAAIILLLLVVVAKTLGDEGTTRRSIWAETEGGPRAVFLLLTFAYFFATELAWAQTIGKRVMKLRVVRLDGSRPGAGPVALRNLLRFVDAFPALYIVGAIVLFTFGNKRQRLGDMAARTTVVAEETPEPPPPPDRPSNDDVLTSVLR
jgi:uncharacterized RDD family membrane protein YckC